LHVAKEEPRDPGTREAKGLEKGLQPTTIGKGIFFVERKKKREEGKSGKGEFPAHLVKKINFFSTLCISKR